MHLLWWTLSLLAQKFKHTIPRLCNTHYAIVTILLTLFALRDSFIITSSIFYIYSIYSTLSLLIIRISKWYKINKLKIYFLISYFMFKQMYSKSVKQVSSTWMLKENKDIQISFGFDSQYFEMLRSLLTTIFESYILHMIGLDLRKVFLEYTNHVNLPL